MGGRGSKAQEYTLNLCRAICRGLVKQKMYDCSGKACTNSMQLKQLKSLKTNIQQWQETEKIDGDEKRMSFEGDGSVLSLVLAHPPVGVLYGGLIGGRMISEDGLSSAVATKPDDIHNLPSHWKDTKHEPSGTAFAHLVVDAAIAAARPLLPE